MTRIGAAIGAGASLSGGAGMRLRGWLAAFAQELRSCARAESGRLGLWAPVAIGAGAASYFALPFEPAQILVMAALAFAAAMWRMRPKSGFSAAAAAALFLLGVAAADFRTDLVEAPVLAKEIKPREITGVLAAVDEAARSRRLLIDVETISGIAAEATPVRVRINWRGREFEALPGDLISIRAGLSPPPGPAAPGSYDFARQLYFERIGAVGYAVAPPAVIARENRGLAASWRKTIELARVGLARRIVDATANDGGAIVAAVITGKREGVPEHAETALRDSGLAHLLAISGLHMGLATGLIFFCVRISLAAFEPVALRFPIKKWAAAAALVSGFAYLLLSGGGWSARRAFIMTSVIFIAIIADRRGLSLRNVAIAATIIILATPEAVLHPGFQMSFAAVTALIAAYEWASARIDKERDYSILARLRRYIVGVAATDTIAAVATAPYGLYHFNRAALYSLAANLVAVPVMAFWAMPAALLAFVLMPFGLDAGAWRLAAAGFELIVRVGAAVASQPGAIVTIPQGPPAALAVVSLGGLWLCLQRARWRFLGLAGVPAALLLAALYPVPQIFITRDGENVGVVAGAGANARLAMANPRADRFSADVWKEIVGLDPEASPTAALEDVGRCDADGCVADVRGVSVGVSRNIAGLAADCRRADLVIALYFAPYADRRRCAAMLVDRGAAWRGGAQAVRIDDRGAIHLRPTFTPETRRNWSPGGLNAS